MSPLRRRKEQEPTHKRVAVRTASMVVYHSQPVRGLSVKDDRVIAAGGYTLTDADHERGWVDLDEVQK